MILVIAACGGGTASSTIPSAENLDRYSSSQLASEELCEHAVANVERHEFLSTTVPVRDKGLFNRADYDRRHRDRVRACQVKLSERQAACMAVAGSMQYVQNCDRFAELQ